MPGGSMIQMLGILAIFVVLYMLMIRPQRKKEKAINEMRNALKVGDKITTIGGIKATILTVKDDSLVIQVGADKVKFEVMRWAVSRVDNDADAKKADTSKAATKTEKAETKEDAESEKPEAKKPKKLTAKKPANDEADDKKK